MKLINTIKAFFTRNMAYSDAYSIQSGTPQYTNWTVQKAVQDGYEACSWVYRAVSLITKSAAGVPWGVTNKDGESIEHHVADILNRPNNSISRQDVFELLISWLELSGNAYLKSVKSGGKTVELWPVSPDRLHPVLSKNISEWIKGYALDTSTKVNYTPEEIIHFKYFNPASPYLGVSSLQAVSKTVDIDVDQLNWNKAAMQNRGVLDGIFSFKKEFRSQDDADAIAEKLNEKYAGAGNARKLGVVGSEAKYVRTALTPVQMDFLESRRFNRDEIFIAFGVPPQYAGTQESSTYNNYQTSELIFWFQKIIPLLDDLSETLNFFFYDELAGNKVSYNLNNIPAIRRALLERSKTAKTLFEMGVPMEQLNRIFSFGVQEFEGWGVSCLLKKEETVGVKEVKSNTDKIETRNQLIHTRDIDKEIEGREEYAKKQSSAIEALFEKQQEIIFEAIKDNVSNKGAVSYIDPEKLLADTWGEWEELYNELTLEYALEAADQVVIQKRAIEPGVEAIIAKHLAEDEIVKMELGHITNTTLHTLSLQIEQGIVEGWTVAQLQQAIIDTGVLSSSRALTLSRTITGTSGSMGQFLSAKHTGATHKKWINSGFEVRDLHIERGLEAKVKINERYSAKMGASMGPMYPLDIVLLPGDRVNCRCSQIFSIE